MNNRILILWEESFSVHNRAVDVVSKLISTYPVRLCIDTMFSSQADICELINGRENQKNYFYDVENLAEDCTELFVPFISKRFLSELMDFNYDSPFCAAVMVALSKNMKVWTLPDIIFNGSNPVINSEIKKKNLFLKNLGIKIEDLDFKDKKSSEVLNSSKNIITENDAIMISENGTNELKLLKGDILTSLAEDYLKSKNITVIRSD